MADQPNKSDIESVFHRLRSIPANKACFDCNAKNPSWASITYGVFICIDCSAVHRGLGVHLTFVRSTQLDTNWTWLQMRQMQVGGNSNAMQFFSQHNCITTDAQKKYHSRAAQLYREKLQQLALKAIQNSQLHMHPRVEEKQDEKEVDFFKDEELFTSPNVPALVQPKPEPVKEPSKAMLDPGEGPKINFTLNDTEERKSTIGVRKIQQKKSGLGSKKGGLGATKVKTNFADLEREAAQAEESRLRDHEESVKAAELSAQEKVEREAAVRLAYKDLSDQQHKKEELLKKVDPRKAEQMERLGMGFDAKAGISHSALSDMQTIEQENAQATTGNNLISLGKLRISDSDSFFDDFGFTSSSFSMNRNTSSGFGSNKGLDTLLSESNNSRDTWVIVDDPPLEKPRSVSRPVDRTPTRNVVDSSSSSDTAQKKFGGAKAISSDQFFNERVNDYEHQTNLNRFQGSSSISSSEFFGNDRDDPNAAGKFQTPDLEDVRESVRQGVTKVAGKISSLANGMMSSLQEKYGY